MELTDHIRINRASELIEEIR